MCPRHVYQPALGHTGRRKRVCARSCANLRVVPLPVPDSYCLFFVRVRLLVCSARVYPTVCACMCANVHVCMCADVHLCVYVPATGAAAGRLPGGAPRPRRGHAHPAPPVSPQLYRILVTLWICYFKYATQILYRTDSYNLYYSSSVH
jgi:hypothetical protein